MSNQYKRESINTDMVVNYRQQVPASNAINLIGNGDVYAPSTC